jgi:hypothetical protein
MHHVTALLENNRVRCLLVDFSKAFDIVDHAVIVETLTKLSLPGNVIDWFISSLTDPSLTLFYVFFIAT